MCDDSPRPNAEKVQVRLSKARTILDQSVNKPNRHIRDEEKSDYFSTRLRFILLISPRSSPPSVQDENRLNGSLYERQNFGDQSVGAVAVIVFCEITAHDAEH